MKFRLGSILRDPVTGLQGTAVGYSTMTTGTIQYGLRFAPKPDAEKYPEAIYLDEGLLEFVHEGISALIPSPQVDIPINLGDEVEDMVLHMRGIVTERVDFLNNCVLFSVQPRSRFWQQKPPDTFFVDYKRLRVIKPAKQREAQVSVVNLVVQKTTGGPEREFRSMRD